MRNIKSTIVSLVMLLFCSICFGQDWIVKNASESTTFVLAIRPLSNDKLAYREYVIKPKPNKKNTRKIPIDYTGKWDIKVKAIYDGHAGDFVSIQPENLLKLAEAKKEFFIHEKIRAVPVQGKYVNKAFVREVASEKKQLTLSNMDFARKHLMKSSWHTRFEAKNGKWYTDTTNFVGEAATCTGKPPATLTKVKYTATQSDFDIRGVWTSQGKHGQFIFKGKVATPNEFKGDYNFSDAPNDWRPWNGTRIEVRKAVPKGR